MTGKPNGDNINQAIADVNKVAMAPFNVKLPTGRSFVVHVPADITDAEAWYAVNALTQIVGKLQSMRAGPQLVVPSGLSIPKPPS